MQSHLSYSTRDLATGVAALIQAGYKALADGGKIIFVGVSDLKYQLPVSPIELLGCVIWITGSRSGDAVPSEVRMVTRTTLQGIADSIPEILPELVRYYREGRFPFDKMVRYYKVSTPIVFTISP